MNLHLVQINVVDVPEARRFYVDTLGFEEIGDPASGVATLRLDDGPLMLLYPVERRVDVDYPNQTGTTVVFSVRDIEETVRRWRERGVELIPCEWANNDTGIGDCPFGRFIAFRDPSGNVNEIIQPHR